MGLADILEGQKKLVNHRRDSWNLDRQPSQWQLRSCGEANTNPYLTVRASRRSTRDERPYTSPGLTRRAATWPGPSLILGRHRTLEPC